jgi:hypothetical protein
VRLNYVGERKGWNTYWRGEFEILVVYKELLGQDKCFGEEEQKEEVGDGWTVIDLKSGSQAGGQSSNVASCPRT